jgi:AcrR family transcriptional regulator
VNPQRLHRNILRLCRLRGTTLTAIARETGLSVLCVCRAAGADPQAPADHTPASGTVQAIATALGVSPGALAEAETEDELHAAMRSNAALLSESIEPRRRGGLCSAFWRHFIATGR